MKRSITPSDDGRFLRRTGNEQVRRRRRARTFNRLFAWGGVGLMLTVIVGMMVWGGHHFLTHSDRFTVRKAVIAGTGYAPQEEIRELTDPYLGRNLFEADLAALQAKLEKLSWVRTAHPKRRMPDTLLVQIEERVPSAFVMIEKDLYLADGDGVLLDRLAPQHAEYDFPVLTGLDGAGKATLRRKVQQGAALVDYLYRVRPSFAHQVSQIDLSKDDTLELRLNGGGPPLKLNSHSFGLNLDNYLAIRNYIDSNYTRIKYVDLRWKDRISIMPTAGRFAHHGAER